MATERVDKMLVRLAWGQGVLFAFIACVATYFRGFQPEVIVGWIALIILTLLGLCTGYGVSRKIQAGGSFVLAALFLVASTIRRDSWGIDRGDLQDMAIGAASLAAWLLAFDARTGEPVRLLGHVAGALAALLMLILCGMLISATALSQTDPLKAVLVASILAALYDLSGPQWKAPLAIVAGIVIVVVVVHIAPRTP